MTKCSRRFFLSGGDGPPAQENSYLSSDRNHAYARLVNCLSSFFLSSKSSSKSPARIPFTRLNVRLSMVFWSTSAYVTLAFSSWWKIRFIGTFFANEPLWWKAVSERMTFLLVRFIRKLVPCARTAKLVAGLRSADGNVHPCGTIPKWHARSLVWCSRERTRLARPTQSIMAPVTFRKDKCSRRANSSLSTAYRVFSF